MKKIITTLIFGVIYATGAYANSCEYEGLKSTEFRLTEKAKQSVTYNFFIDPNKNLIAGVNKNEKGYKSLKENNFKILDTGVPTKYHDSLSQYNLKNFKSDININGKAYTVNKSLSTKVVTANCDTYYLNFDRPLDEMYVKYTFERNDGKPVTIDSLVELLGKALQPKDTAATVSFDRFEKIVNIKTKPFENMLLRGIYNPTTKKTTLVQLYLDATFIGGWGEIKVAYDTQGVTHEVILINHEANCSNRYMGCKLNETLGVTLTEDFIRKNKEGFELKLKGKQERVISVSKDLVVSFLDGLDSAKKNY